MTERETLVLLPGLLCDAALWQYQLSALAEFAEPVVADLTGSATMAELALDVLRTAPPRFALAGLSMGGYVAFEILRRAPERVSRAAFLDTQARPDTPEVRERRLALIDLAARGRFRGVTPRLLPQLLHPDNLKTPLAGIVTGMAERIGQEAFVRQQRAIIGRIDSLPGLRDIHVPALVICGAEDRLTPPGLAAEIADGIAGADLLIVERSGHLSPLEQPEPVNRALIDWLDR
jgi:pimeloyl-ACP methyl ester carboxylesterase